MAIEAVSLAPPTPQTTLNLWYGLHNFTWHEQLVKSLVEIRAVDASLEVPQHRASHKHRDEKRNPQIRAVQVKFYADIFSCKSFCAPERLKEHEHAV